ncbi:MAG: glycosyltransferase [Clostridia bacterium]|nr:glycosyltransferase [Clostridia bacterium]
MKISLCIPMYNESSIINDTLKTVSEYMEATFDDYEVLFSDDGSTDNCRAAVEAFPNERIRAIGYEKNQGKGAAIRHGVMNAVGDIIIFTDCDLAYGLDVVKSAVDMFTAHPDADVVIGSRNLSGDGYDGYTFIRKLASKTYIKCLALAAGFKLTDSQCGFKSFRRETAHKIFETCEVNGFAFDFEVLIKANNMGAKIYEMPVKVINHRESKVNVWRDSIKMLRDVSAIKKRNKRTGA